MGSCPLPWRQCVRQPHWSKFGIGRCTRVATCRPPQGLQSPVHASSALFWHRIASFGHRVRISPRAQDAASPCFLQAESRFGAALDGFYPVKEPKAEEKWGFPQNRGAHLPLAHCGWGGRSP